MTLSPKETLQKAREQSGAPLLAPRSLDAQGRCCGRKPLHYKRPTPYYFCTRCDAQFSMDGRQQANWAYLPLRDNFTPKYPEQDYWQKVSLVLHTPSSPEPQP